MKIHFTLLLLILSPFAFAQKIDFNLNKYYLPDVKYNSLIGQFNFNGSGDKNTKNVFSNLRLDYYTYRRNAKWQNTLYITLQSNPQKRYDLNNTQFKWNNEIEWSTQNRFYIFKNPKLFLEGDWNQIISHNFLTKDISTPSDVRHKLLVSTSAPIMVGFGRVEDISETWRAVRIFQAFDQLEMLYDYPNDHVIMEMAKQMAVQKNKRFLDSRIGRIKRLTEIHTLLDSTGLLNTKSIAYFTNLVDIWYYGVNQKRWTGSAFTIGIEPHQFYLHQSLLQSRLPVQKQNALLGIVRYEYHKALNYKWQVDFDGRVRAGIIRQTNLGYTTKKNIGTLLAKLTASYFPSDRTTLNWSIKSEYFTHEKQINYYANFFMYYYVSPKIRFQTSLSYLKEYQFFPYAWYGDPFSLNGLNTFRYDLSTGSFLQNRLPKFSIDIRFIYNFF